MSRKGERILIFPNMEAIVINEKELNEIIKYLR